MTSPPGTQEFLDFAEPILASINDPAFSAQIRDIEHGQWEPAFEALLLRMMELDPARVPFDPEVAGRLADESGLTDQGVLDPDTWARFLRWSDR